MLLNARARVQQAKEKSFIFMPPKRNTKNFFSLSSFVCF